MKYPHVGKMSIVGVELITTLRLKKVTSVYLKQQIVERTLVHATKLHCTLSIAQRYHNLLHGAQPSPNFNVLPDGLHHGCEKIACGSIP